jgi:hypothetical protein
MKFILFSLIASTFTTAVMAREMNYLEEAYDTSKFDTISVANFNQDLKVTYLTKLLDYQQKMYDKKISFLEEELKKSHDRLIEKSMNQEKFEDAMATKYSAEAILLKKELAYKTKSLFEIQRQMEKMKPSEDLKNMIKLNSEMASELRKSEDKMAFIQLKYIEATPGVNSKSRMPASVHKGK